MLTPNGELTWSSAHFHGRFTFLGIWTWTWAHNGLSCARSFWIWSPRCSQKLAWSMYAKHGGCEVTMQSLTIADSFSWHVFSIKLEWVYNIVLYYITYQTSFIVYVYHILYMYTCFIHVQNCRQRCFQIKHGSWWLRKVSGFPSGSVHTGAFGDAAGDRRQLWRFSKNAHNVNKALKEDNMVNRDSLCFWIFIQLKWKTKALKLVQQVGQYSRAELQKHHFAHWKMSLLIRCVDILLYAMH